MRSKSKRIPKPMQRRQGQLTYYYVLKRSGKLTEAEAWAAKHRLYAVPPLYPAYTLSVVNAAPKAAPPTDATTLSDAPLPAANSAALSSLSDAPLLAAPRQLAPLTAAFSGGAGASENGLAQNLDQSPQRGENLQLEVAKAGVHGPTALVGKAPDGASLASPSGEVEGKLKSSQANMIISVSNRLENGDWVVSGEGVVGGNCRNRWFVEVQVDGKWAKAAVGDSPVRRGQRVRVRLEWVSADGRDAEYAIVEALPDREEPRQAAPVGRPEQGNVGISHQLAAASNQLTPQMPVKSKEGVFLTMPPQSMGMQQLPVPVVHDQPKEVVFQTTTMEKLVEAEKVGVMHASGKTGLIPAPDTDFRSPVMDDVAPVAPEPAATPAGVEGLGDYDFMERARREAIAALMGQG